MKLVLSSFGTSLATRERAREIVATLGSAEVGELEVDLNGVTASPSFMAELLTRLGVQYLRISFDGGSEHMRGLTTSLVGKLGLSGRVRDLAPS